MLRALREAFWLRLPVPGLGALPLNVLAVAGVGILGFAEHALWLLGAGAEAAYLFALATNPRFQNLLAAQDLAAARATEDAGRARLLTRLPPASRARLEAVEGKVARVAVLLRSHPEEDLLAESSLDALRQLAGVHARLLLAEQELRHARQEFDPAALTRQAAALERELAAPAGSSPALSPALLESKRATLGILRRRLGNVQARDRSLAEVASDLARIEAQVDLAVEEASLQGARPEAAAGTATTLGLLDQILASNTALGGGGVDVNGAEPIATDAPGPLPPPLPHDDRRSRSPQPE